jgi:copper chaperone CopZ
MKPSRPFLVAVLGISLMLTGIGSVQADSRTWTQASSGRTIEGEFVKVEGENVHIRRAGGSIIPVPIKMLSAEDQKFITAQAPPATSPSPAPGDKPTAEGDAEPITIKLHEMHLCCSACGRRVEELVAEMEGVKVDVDRKEGIVTLDAPGKKAAQDAVNAMADAGFYGKSDSHDIDFKGKGAKAEKIKSATVTGVHLCCKGCVTAADKAITSVEGVEEHTAKSKAESFVITGDFSPSEVLRNLRKAGLNATITETGAAAEAK